MPGEEEARVAGGGARVRTLMEPLRGRSFRLYWVGQTTSAYGDQVFLIALALQVLRLGGGARELGLVNAAAGTALVVFLLVGGVVVDRLPRRAVMVVSDLVRMAVLGYLGVASLAGSLRIPSLAAAGWSTGPPTPSSGPPSWPCCPTWSPGSS
jgi:MFS family permease